MQIKADYEKQIQDLSQQLLVAQSSATSAAASNNQQTEKQIAELTLSLQQQKEQYEVNHFVEIMIYNCRLIFKLQAAIKDLQARLDKENQNSQEKLATLQKDFAAKENSYQTQIKEIQTSFADLDQKQKQFTAEKQQIEAKAGQEAQRAQSLEQQLKEAEVRNYLE